MNVKFRQYNTSQRRPTAKRLPGEIAKSIINDDHLKIRGIRVCGVGEETNMPIFLISEGREDHSEEIGKGLEN